MKKYLYIAKTEFKNELQYITDALVSFLSFTLIIYIYLNLWRYMYDDPSSLIKGYTIEQMIWYVLATEMMWKSLGGRSICASISEEVKSGAIAYKLSKPFKYIFYILSNFIGKFIYKFLVYLVLGIILGLILIGPLPKLTIIELLIVLISVLFSTIISIFIITSIGLLAFFIEDSQPFYWVYSKVILVIGTLFPIELFPKVIQPILNYSPIYAMSYGPAKLFVDFSYDKALSVIISQIAYIFISYTICNLIYRRGVKSINVNGG